MLSVTCGTTKKSDLKLEEGLLGKRKGSEERGRARWIKGGWS
jgi:hypothetical protein